MTTLRREILPPEQVRVWEKCSEPSRKWGAYLAGGTSVALYLGHRRSVDFDWFTPRTIPPTAVLADVQAMKVGPVEVLQNKEGTFLSNVAGVSFSLFRYPYPLLESPTDLDGSKLASLRDLAAMKMVAIHQRGTKKDFIDVHELLVERVFTLPDMIEASRQRYQLGDTSGIVRALTYFSDADPMPMPVMLKPRTWDEVKAGMIHHVEMMTGQKLSSDKPRPRRGRR